MSQPIFTTPEVHNKGWGEERWIANTPEYCGKLLRFNPGAKFSLHFHANKAESFYVLSGAVLFTHTIPETGKTRSRILETGEVVHIPRLCAHRAEALQGGATLLEVSTHHEDSDSYRVAPGDSQRVD